MLTPIVHELSRGSAHAGWVSSLREPEPEPVASLVTVDNVRYLAAKREELRHRQGVDVRPGTFVRTG